MNCYEQALITIKILLMYAYKQLSLSSRL